MNINDFDLDDIVTDGNGNYARVCEDCDAPHDQYYGNCEPPDNTDNIPIVSDFYRE